MHVQNDSPAPSQLTRETFSPDLIDRAIATIPSQQTRRNYRRAIDGMLVFAGRRPITRDLLHRWRDSLAKRITPGSVNASLCGVRKLFEEAELAGVIDGAQARELSSIKGLRQLGQSTGNWLEREQCRAILQVPNRRTITGKRAYCALAVLLGCALRRTELAELEIEQIQMRDGRWVITSLRGKGNRIRTVAVPAWVKEAVDSWTKAAGIESGRLMRRTGKDSSSLSTGAIWKIVQRSAAKIGVPNLGPHDLRRTCAKLCRARGGRIESIQAMLGHSSIATTERYLGSTEDLRHAVNDDLGIWA